VQHRELEFASRAFDSIEINGSFYSLQRPPVTSGGIAKRQGILFLASKDLVSSPT
jgi:uncharacterized protein YecE (DUF72 family)